jgi:hypothetical protein
MARKITSKEGTITLMHRGYPVAQLCFKGTAHKQSIISNWKKLYGAAKVTPENIIAENTVG